MCSYLHQFIQHDSIKPRQVLDVVPLHHRTVLPDVSSELLHVEDQLCYVPVTHKYINRCETKAAKEKTSQRMQ